MVETLLKKQKLLLLCKLTNIIIIWTAFGQLQLQRIWWLESSMSIFCNFNHFDNLIISLKIVYEQYLKAIVSCVQIGSIGWTWKGVGDVVTITFQHLKVCRQIGVKKLQGIAETKLRARLLQWNHRAILWQFSSKLMVALHMEGNETFHFDWDNSSDCNPSSNN